jgi:transcriptional regulator with XRE-family HTH domain
MALFFDQAWFDARLKELGGTRDDVARLLKLSSEQVAELWKDQRELRTADVQALASYLKVAAVEVAKRAGVSTPVPADSKPVEQQLEEVNERLTRIERMIVELKTLVLQQAK